MIGLQEVVVAQALGTLSWDLPARVNYTPNTELPFTLLVANPTTGARSYGLQAQVLIGGELVWFADLLVEGARWFQVPAGQRITIRGQFQAERSDFLLRILLIDQGANQVVAQVQSELVSPTAPGPTPTPTPTPTPGFDIAPLFGVMALGLVLGLVGSMGGMLRQEE